ncbi:MAG: hypothetical protein AB7R55_02750 [Gemmatimonadales bacterium]
MDSTIDGASARRDAVTYTTLGLTRSATSAKPLLRPSSAVLVVLATAAGAVVAALGRAIHPKLPAATRPTTAMPTILT